MSDGYGSVRSAAAALNVSDNFPAWATRNGVSGDTGDSDFDGLPNLVEYALGTDPQNASPAPGAAQDGSYLTLTYTKVKNTPDIVCVAEVSASPAGAWTSAAADVEQLWQVTDNGATQTITARDKTPVAGAGRRFIRLRVTRP